ncbi:DUF1749-domain-containing protein, partial [Wilcoxina mikolae CBS 423.85]
PGLVAFEHLPAQHTASENKLLFVGGLGDGLFTVPIVRQLMNIEGWGVIEILTSSTYKGWGMGSVKRDAAEIAQAVEYFRNSHKGSKLVLMGHSTGSQDTMQYLLNVSSGAAPALDGAIMQAPVSDREVIVMTTSKTAYLTSLNFCESFIKDGRGKEILPQEMRPRFEDTPISAERWYSLAAPLDANGKPQGSEDFFSSDLNDETLAETFGKIPKDTPILALYSGDDQCVPPDVDKEKLVRRWNSVAEASGVNFKASVVPGASHNIADVPAEVLEDFVGRVSGFLESVSKESGDQVTLG